MSVGARQIVVVSPLPDASAFRTWAQQNFNRWISVCGVGASDLVKEDAESIGIDGLVFRLSDPFSESVEWDGGEQPGARAFLEHSTPVLRANLLQAVRGLVKALEEGERVVVFCHLGRSRSPLVAAAGLMLTTGMTPLDAWAQVTEFDPERRPTWLTLAALNWIKSTWNPTKGSRNDLL
jgi:predicted protein tyrosine phosphatase